MLTIDGSAGEGGGQILRSALGLSLVTGRPFHIANIRANRKKPGLMRQHLTAVLAAAEIGNAHIEGAAIGSGNLVFIPGKITPGAYHFSIGSAGSCTLVLQTLLPALILADGPSSLIVEGGTHNPMAPPFDFLAHTFLPLIHRMGAQVSARLDRPGFFPAGGGQVTITVTPASTLQPIELVSLSTISFSAQTVCAQLPEQIGKRELQVVHNELAIDSDRMSEMHLDHCGPGNTLTVFVHSDQLTETFTGFGRKHVSAEAVALETVQQVRKYIEAASPVGIHLADQLLLPMALAGSGRFRTGKPSSHTLTNIAVIKQFLDINCTCSQVTDTAWEIGI
jgi:RNA 3'-terminal phosphate cyclase (ATP)